MKHDGTSAPDGRPAGEDVMYYYNAPVAPVRKGDHPHPGMLVDWAEFRKVGEAGGLRLKKTMELTIGDLKSFQDYVRVNGGCKCKHYFGVE